MHSSEHGTLFLKALINLGLHGNAYDYKYLWYNAKLSRNFLWTPVFMFHANIQYRRETMQHNLIQESEAFKKLC